MPTQAAPGDLELIRAFVNTIDLEDGVDVLAEPGSARAWLRERGLLEDTDELDEAGLGEVRALRGALRRLVASSGEGEPARRALDDLNRIATEGGLTVRFDPPGDARLTATADGLAGVLGHLLALVGEAMRACTWSRLKLCDNDECAWAFYDRSRNRSARWCTMEVCGNRMKARSYRARHGGT